MAWRTEDTVAVRYRSKGTKRERSIGLPFTWNMVGLAFASMRSWIVLWASLEPSTSMRSALMNAEFALSKPIVPTGPRHRGSISSTTPRAGAVVTMGICRRCTASERLSPSLSAPDPASIMGREAPSKASFNLSTKAGETTGRAACEAGLVPIPSSMMFTTTGPDGGIAARRKASWSASGSPATTS